MGQMSYNRVGYGRIKCHGSRGFKLNPKRFSVLKLRARFLCLFRLLNRWRCSYGKALQSLKKSMSQKNGSAGIGITRNNSTSSRKSLFAEVVREKGRVQDYQCRLRSLGRSNSFYAEAIADCLEFIKRSSISVDQNPVVER